MLRFEECVNVMRSANMITDKEHLKLKEMFEAQGPESDTNVTLIFPDFKAPDDWEDYKALRETINDLGITWKVAIKMLEKAMKEKAGK
jgi:hypothetical protein